MPPAMECRERRGVGVATLGGTCVYAVSSSGMTAPGVSRQAAIADNGLLLTGGLDINGSLSLDDVDVEGS